MVLRICSICTCLVLATCLSGQQYHPSAAKKDVKSQRGEFSLGKGTALEMVGFKLANTVAVLSVTVSDCDHGGED